MTDTDNTDNDGTQVVEGTLDETTDEEQPEDGSDVLIYEGDEDSANSTVHHYLENLRADLIKDPTLNSTIINRIVSIFQRNFAVNSILFFSFIGQNCKNDFF